MGQKKLKNLEKKQGGKKKLGVKKCHQKVKKMDQKINKKIIKKLKNNGGKKSGVKKSWGKKIKKV